MILTEALQTSDRVVLREEGREWRVFFGVPQFASRMKKEDQPHFLYITYRCWRTSESREWTQWVDGHLTREATLSNDWEPEFE